MYYVWRLYHIVGCAPTVLAAISNVTDFLDGIVMPPPLQPSPPQTPPLQPSPSRTPPLQPSPHQTPPL